ncbi:MAG: hypothetical protein WD055_03975 [Candidatus Dependentiae bacterium]
MYSIKNSYFMITMLLLVGVHQVVYSDMKSWAKILESKTKNERKDVTDYKLASKFVDELKNTKMKYSIQNNALRRIAVWGIPINSPPYVLAVVPPKVKAEIIIPGTLLKMYVIDESIMMQGGADAAKKGTRVFEQFLKTVPKEKWVKLFYYGGSLEYIFERPRALSLQFLKDIANKIVEAGGVIKDGFSVSSIKTAGGYSLVVTTDESGFRRWSMQNKRIRI